jgi:hypothetical protein
VLERLGTQQSTSLCHSTWWRRVTARWTSAARPRRFCDRKPLWKKERKMPDVIVKLWPGKSEQQKTRLAEAIAKDVYGRLELRG